MIAGCIGTVVVYHSLLVGLAGLLFGWGWLAGLAGGFIVWRFAWAGVREGAADGADGKQ
jgi:hypothetical protein